MSPEEIETAIVAIRTWVEEEEPPKGWPPLMMQIRENLERLLEKEEWEEAIQLARTYCEQAAVHAKHNYIPSWIENIPNHPLTLIRVEALKVGHTFWMPVDYFEDPMRHIFN